MFWCNTRIFINIFIFYEIHFQILFKKDEIHFQILFKKDEIHFQILFKKDENYLIFTKKMGKI
jgi:hypothetical protein